MPDLLTGPVVRSLPLWYGQDTTFIVNNIVPDSNPKQYIDYPPGTTARVIIDRAHDTYTVEAVIDGYIATFNLLAEETDSVKKDTLWRIQFTFPGIGHKAPIVGKVVRKDA